MKKYFLILIILIIIIFIPIIPQKTSDCVLVDGTYTSMTACVYDYQGENGPATLQKRTTYESIFEILIGKNSNLVG